MKNKLFKIIICLVVLIVISSVYSGCSTTIEITTNDIYFANTSKTLLETYDNYYMDSIFYNKEGQALQNKSSIFYINKTKKYVKQAGARFVMSEDNVVGYNIKYYESSNFTKVLNLTDSPLKITQDIVAKSTIDYEIVTNAQQNGKVINVTTTIPSAIAKILLKDDYVENDIIKTFYNLNADTKSVISVDSIVVHADKTEWFYSQIDVFYNQKMPEDMESIIDRENDTNCYKVSFVRLDKTTKTILDVENTTVKKGDYANARLKTGYNLYIDQQCSVKYDGITKNNLILYYFYD